MYSVCFPNGELYWCQYQERLLEAPTCWTRCCRFRRNRFITRERVFVRKEQAFQFLRNYASQCPTLMIRVIPYKWNSITQQFYRDDYHWIWNPAQNQIQFLRTDM
jgi:hypothetical protein